ncbi:hypothetical protein J4438_01405 [Candidatus Woesearchaeota archaeon]|nr:hypothetical protein [Candidatus Woesearchaeota archaeon]
MNKKAQIGIQETILVIFVFFIVLMIGMIFFFQLNMKSIQNDIDQYNEFRFKQLIDIVPNMAELRYSKLGVEDVYCIDLLKARAFSEISSEYDFGKKEIKLISGDEIVLYSKIGRGEIRKVTSPVCVYDPRNGKFYLGELDIGWWA